MNRLRRPLPGTSLDYCDAATAVEALRAGAWAQLPYTSRVLAENLVRRAPPEILDECLLQLIHSERSRDFPWFPARVVCHDILGQTALVDLAGLRDAIAERGGDPALVNPVVPTQLVVDHSLAVEHGGYVPDAFARNRAIEERRKPQDGRIKIRFQDHGQNKDIDFRVSCLPTLFGEKIVMRLLDKDKLMLDMTKLGFEPESLVRYEAAIQRPWGMVLVTGPTGSGKTNTLYSSIAKLNSTETNIMTAEDPVEFNLAGINQVQVTPRGGVTFATALRSNEVMMERVQRMQIFNQYEEDQDLLEDVLTENQQAIQMTSIATEQN